MSGRTVMKRRAPASFTPIWMRIASDIMFALYIALLFRLTVFRDNFSINNFMLGGNVNLTVFKDLIDLIRRGGAFYFFYLLLGNIAAFLPLGAYLAYRTKMHLISTMLTGAAVSFIIEFLQFAFDVGVTEIDDLILNTLGAFAGAATVRMVSALAAKKREQKN